MKLGKNLISMLAILSLNTSCISLEEKNLKVNGPNQGVRRVATEKREIASSDCDVVLEN